MDDNTTATETTAPSDAPAPASAVDVKALASRVDALGWLPRQLTEVSGRIKVLESSHAGVFDLHNRIAAIEEKLAEIARPVAQAVAGAAGALASVAGGAVGRVAAVIEHAAEAVATMCPNHPDAPQTANGCTEPGCTHSP